MARIAAIQAAKSTAHLIPLCHPLPLNYVAVDFEVGEKEISIRCEVATRAPTGVEMEALTGVTVAALTLYDMMKSADKTMRIEGIDACQQGQEMKVARLTISDRASAGIYADKSGPEIERVFRESMAGTRAT